MSKQEEMRVEQEEMRVEQVLMERYRQPSGVIIKLKLLEIPNGFAGHPYSVERCVNEQWQHRAYSLTYGKAMQYFNSHRDFERHIGSVRTLLGDADD